MKLYGKLDEEAITDISCNLKAFEEYDDTKEAVSMYDVPFEENLDAFLIIVLSQNMIYFSKMVNTIMKDDSVRGERTFEYKEGKLVKQQFEPY